MHSNRVVEWRSLRVLVTSKRLHFTEFYIPCSRLWQDKNRANNIWVEFLPKKFQGVFVISQDSCIGDLVTHSLKDTLEIQSTSGDLTWPAKRQWQRPLRKKVMFKVIFGFVERSELGPWWFSTLLYLGHKDVMEEGNGQYCQKHKLWKKCGKQHDMYEAKKGVLNLTYLT